MRTKVDELIDALAVTAEVTGTDLSKGAAKVLALDLAPFEHGQVMAALVRCRRELKGRLTIAAIIERLDDGRPGPAEAWAMIPQDEDGSVVWSEEMAQAYGVAAPLLAMGQTIAARSAFVEKYAALIATARAEQRPPKWTPSLGRDPWGREAALLTAVQAKRIAEESAQRLIPNLQPPEANVAAMLPEFK
jgi:hypothetical protein